MKLPFSNKLRFYHAIYVVVALLCVFSLYAAFSLSGSLLAPLVQILIGWAIILSVTRVRYQILNQFSSLGLLLAFILLICTLLFGKGGGGRSLRILGIQFQSFYIATFLIILYISTFLAIKCEKLNPKEKYLHKEDTRFVLIIILISVGMIAVRNISTALLLTLSSVGVLYVAGADWRQLLKFALIGGLALGIYIGIGEFRKSDQEKDATVQNEVSVNGRGSTAMNRIKYWLTGESETVGYGKQMTLAKAAVARSFTRPTGPGKGMMKKNMAEGDNDFIFALICEELSIVAGVVIFVLYSILFYQSILIARKARGNPKKGTQGYFIKLFSTGIGLLILMQALIHIGANVGLIPATGQTLPFISRGITPLIITSIMIGILVNMAKQVDEKTIDPDDELEV